MAHLANRVPTSSTSTIAGLFRDDGKAEKAIEDLRASGFSENEVGVATAHDEGGISDFWNKITSKLGKHERTEHANDLHESLVDSGVPDQQARYFNSVLAQGGVLVTVHTGADRAPKAIGILQRNGADVGSGATEWDRAQTKTQEGTAGRQTMQLVGEILRVHKERVSRGEVRLRKEVVSEKQNIEVPVSREELVIERVPGSGREAAGAEVGSGQKEIRLPLSEERVHVEKKPVVNEEVRVGKRQVQDTKRVTDEVRHEELRTETEGDVRKDQAALKDKTRKSA
jgi:uncharacterized protein (TIGR02271 family)